MPGAADARFLINKCNIPSVIFGPGSTKQAHTTNEFVEIDELIKASKIYALIAVEFLG
jgi:acetylornithine deacetylase/succinyl-diaminopimelate desuccinylase-like protein